MVGMPWLNHYNPAVVAAPGHELRWPTQPDLLSGLTKHAQMSLEQRPCTYTLSGWSTDSQLYYTAECGTSGTQGWTFSPQVPTAARPVNNLPTNLVTTVLPHAEVLGHVESPNAYPAEGEPMTRALLVRGDGLLDPSGQWLALIARHIYGPEDVLIVSTDQLK